MKRKKIVRITTVPQSLRGLLKGQLHFMNSEYEVVGVSSEGKSLEVVKHNEGIKTIAVNMTRTISPLKDIISLIKLYFLFRKERPFIVHTHTPKAGTLGMIAAKLARIPHRLHTVAGMPLLIAKGRKRKLLDFVEKITYRCATKVYPNSNGLKDIIIDEKYAPKEKVKVIGNGSSNGIDTSHFDPSIFQKTMNEELRESLGISKEDFVFIFVGRMVGDKGVNELVKAFCSLTLTEKNIKLLLVGAMESDLDPLEPNVLKLILENPNIIATGFQMDVRPYFAISNLLTFPSFREGFPNVVMQACSMQLNCIVTNINGCNEIIEDGVNGWVIPVKNVKKLQEKMKCSVQNISLSKEMGMKNRKRMIDCYEQKFVWNQILNEYKSLKEI